MDAASSYWWVARTRHGREILVRDRLSELGVEHFIPTEKRRASRGRRTVETPLISSLVFLRTTRQEALDLIHFKGVQADYLFDCATHTLMVVPDKQMDNFRRTLDASVETGGLMDMPLEVGEWVRVTRGALKGVEGRVLELQGKTYVVVGLMNCIFARARVPRAYLEKINVE